MELALYCPLCGYYEQEADKIGRRGDYFTSVSVGSLFGELLAFQFAAWLAALGAENKAHESGGFQIVEAGAHDGRLAKDILSWLRHHRPGTFDTLEYWILEPSPRREKWQRDMLREFSSKVCWFADFNAIAGAGRGAQDLPHCSTSAPPVNGIIFSNELLDALPVRRLSWDARAKAWFEWGVTLDGDRFVWTRLPATTASPESLQGLMHDAGLSLPSELAEVLPDGFVVEVCPAATAWWRQASSLLDRGKLMTLDYGLTADEFFLPQRRHGTLRAYRQHRVSDNPLANPGQQDLTAHVNFTALQAAGTAEGLRTDCFSSQAQFLVRIAEQTWRVPRAFGDWNAERLRQFKTLTHPELLGRPFRVLTQSRPA